MTLWIALIVLSLCALGFIVWPIYRHSGKLTAMLAGVIVFIVVLAAGLYHTIGSPGVPSGAGSLPDTEEVITSLEERLRESPDDIEGWLLLGRSLQAMGRYDEAIPVFEKVVEMEQGQNADTLVALAIALMEQQGGEMSVRSTKLFESALALDPTNPNALFYSGGAAARRGDTALAADRWELLLKQDAPPEIREMLQRKIDEWRGTPPTPVVEQNDTGGIAINLSLSAAATAALPADAMVFVIARDPAQPSPPIAVAPHRLADLPLVVSLSDENSMVPGRLMSGFAELEILARVSLSGQPMAQSGDWFGSLIIAPADTSSVDLMIDQEVP